MQLQISFCACLSGCVGKNLFALVHYFLTLPPSNQLIELRGLLLFIFNNPSEKLTKVPCEVSQIFTQ